MKKSAKELTLNLTEAKAWFFHNSSLTILFLHQSVLLRRLGGGNHLEGFDSTCLECTLRKVLHRVELCSVNSVIDSAALEDEMSTSMDAGSMPSRRCTYAMMV